MVIPYCEVKQIFPEIPEDVMLEPKDKALDYYMTELVEFMGQLKRHSQIKPDHTVKVGELVTVLEHLLNIFKIQRAIIEELKEAVSSE